MSTISNLPVWRLLREDARKWWWHRELRERGDHDGARRAEHQQIRNAVRTWRAALATKDAYCSVGRGGYSVHYEQTASYSTHPAACTLSGYCHRDHWGYTPEIALRLGLCVVDTRSIPDSTITRTIGLPMVAVGSRQCDSIPYGSLSYAPLEYVVSQYQSLGATVYNAEKGSSNRY